VAAAECQDFLIPLATGAARALALTARIAGRADVGRLWIGLARAEAHHALSAEDACQARSWDADCLRQEFRSNIAPWGANREADSWESHLLYTADARL